MRNIRRQSPEYLKRFFRVEASDLASPFFSHLPRWELTSRLKMFFSEDMKAELGGYDAMAELRAQLPDGFDTLNHFCQAQYLETAYLLPGYILSSQGDRMAMAHGIEGRYPFLDYRVVEFAAKLPPVIKMKVLNEKYLLKRVAQGLIPHSIIQRHKQPYRAPDGKSFFRGKDLDYVNEMLSAESMTALGVFNPTAVQALVDKFRSGRASATKDDMALVGILSTAIVIHKFIDNFGGREERCSKLANSYADSL
jgi:asparagine synthase (glutamine-hydrolysing)